LSDMNNMNDMSDMSDTRAATVDIAIIGASLGGVTAAYQAARAGRRTVLVAEYAWLGGQMTSQGVPPDEHRLIERGGASASYLAFRQAIRDSYLKQPTFRHRSILTEGINPGDGWVSRLCFEPARAAAYFENWLKPYVDAGTLTIMRAARVVGATRVGRRVTAVRVTTREGESSALQAAYFLDATDTGALLHHAGLDTRLGKEARDAFGEADAPLVADVHDQQPVTYVMALARGEHAAAIIDPPRDYAAWKAHRVPHYGHLLFSDAMPGAQRGETARLPFFAEGQTLDWWRYRRVVAAHNWEPPRTEISLINWAQNDYARAPLLDGAQSEDAVVEQAKSLSRCWLHWLQTEAPRADGGRGYAELDLAPEVLGTEDGFAQQVYVRESRRIVGRDVLTQRDIVWNPAEHGARAVPTPVHVANSVGIGWYNMDIHPTCTSGHGVNAKVRPFTLPLGVFIPHDCDNVIPACKNIGVTHLVNAATRVHPIEWLIGEVAALLADHALTQNVSPAALHAHAGSVAAFQSQLVRAGIPIAWDESLFQVEVRDEPDRAAVTDNQ
jgi:hypothetical protein